MRTSGTWTARWESGGSSDEITFEVRPFRLPRFTVELSAEERWYHMGERIALEGVARYTSGAPVARAPVQVRLGVSEGNWPLPLAWEKTYTATTERDGTFRLEIGEVPPEEILRRELVKLRAVASVTEAADFQAASMAVA